MKLETADYTFTFLTPCFCGGADQHERAELRSASIRGVVRWWHTAAGIQPSVTDTWGIAATASKVGLEILTPIVSEKKDKILVHKTDKPGYRPVLPFDKEYTLRLQRLSGCSGAQWRAANEAVAVWLLLGGLGTRQNRGAGSVWPLKIERSPVAELLTEAIQDEGKFSRSVQRLLNNQRLRFVLLDQPFNTQEDARKTASDMIGGPFQKAEASLLRALNFPFGSDRPRKPSPLKFKVVKFGSQYQLLVVWDSERTNTAKELADGVNLLAYKKAIGKLLQPKLSLLTR